MLPVHECNGVYTYVHLLYGFLFRGSKRNSLACVIAINNNYAHFFPVLLLLQLLCTIFCFLF